MRSLSQLPLGVLLLAESTAAAVPESVGSWLSQAMAVVGIAAGLLYFANEYRKFREGTKKEDASHATKTELDLVASNARAAIDKLEGYTHTSIHELRNMAHTNAIQLARVLVIMEGKDPR